MILVPMVFSYTSSKKKKRKPSMKKKAGKKPKY